MAYNAATDQMTNIVMWAIILGWGLAFPLPPIRKPKEEE